MDEIVRYLLEPGKPKRDAVLDKRTTWQGCLMSAWPSVIATWALLILAVVGLGTRVVAASSLPAWPVLLAYGLLVATILRTV